MSPQIRRLLCVCVGIHIITVTINIMAVQIIASVRMLLVDIAFMGMSFIVAVGTSDRMWLLDITLTAGKATSTS